MAGQQPQGVAIAAPAATTTATAANPADPMVLIDHDWKQALKLNRVIRKELDFVQDKVSQDGDAAMKALTHVEELLKKFRLLCVQIIMINIRAATERSVEDTLWHAHTLVVKAYKIVIANLQGPSSVVVKRRIEKLYSTSLATSSSFYKTYMQRFCGSGKPKELERVARIVKLDGLPADLKVPAQVADPEVEQYFKHSFHKTLVYLGDLSRYRTLLRPRDRSFNAALTYYALANELMPESGYGYHQSGVIYAEAHNHLEIVYNMYRAVACDYPHPLGKTNLEREFRDLRLQKAGGARGPVDAMISWFVKLHAFYYEGEEFTGRKEMEDEVDNHLSTALKTADGPAIDGVLLKMVLINIVAYVAAKDKVQVKWTEPGSRSCQLILQLNVRVLCTLSKLLREQLEELVHQKPWAPATDSDGKHSGQTWFTLRFHRLLPLFRVYMTWIYSHSEELTTFRTHLEPQFGATCKIIADTLTLLLKFLSTASFDVTSVVTWLFPEDEETVGIKCLNGSELYAGCQLRYDALTRKPKPLVHEVPNADRSLDTVAFVRCTDIILCGLRLADNSPFPLEPPSGSHNAFRYVEGLHSQSTSSALLQPTPHGTAGVGSVAVAPPAETPNYPPPSTYDVTLKAVAREAEEEDFSDDQDFYPSQSSKTQAAHQEPPAVTNVPQTMSSSDFPLDTELSRILEGFLAPPEPSADRSEFRSEDTPSGTGSIKAKDSWGTATSTSPTPGSATSKAFPSLPWNWVLDVGSNEPGARHPSTVRSAGSGWDSRPGSSNSPILVQGADDTSDPFVSHGETSSNQPHLGSSAFPPRSSASRGKIDWAVQTAQDSKYRETGLQARNIRNMWAKADRESKLHSRQASIGTAPFPWSPTITEYQPQQYPAETGPVPQISPFSPTSNFNPSSLPQVHSPVCLPVANIQTHVLQLPQGTQNTYALPGMNSVSATNPSYSPHAPPGIFGLQGSPVEGSYGYNAGGSVPPQSHTTNKPSRYNGQVPMSAWDSTGLNPPYSDVNTTVAGGENPNGLIDGNYSQLPAPQGGHGLAQLSWDMVQKQGSRPR